MKLKRKNNGDSNKKNRANIIQYFINRGFLLESEEGRVISFKRGRFEIIRIWLAC